MIVRNALRCESCDGITLTRTAIGHRPRQTHRFPCPGCGIEIVYAVLVDLDNTGMLDADESPQKWLSTLV